MPSTQTRDQETFLKSVLADERERCPSRCIANKLCSVYWGRVFRRVYGEAPTSASDPRWDMLLHGPARIHGGMGGLALARSMEP